MTDSKVDLAQRLRLSAGRLSPANRHYEDVLREAADALERLTADRNKFIEKTTVGGDWDPAQIVLLQQRIKELEDAQMAAVPWGDEKALIARVKELEAERVEDDIDHARWATDILRLTARLAAAEELLYEAEPFVQDPTLRTAISTSLARRVAAHRAADLNFSEAGGRVISARVLRQQKDARIAELEAALRGMVMLYDRFGFNQSERSTDDPIVEWLNIILKAKMLVGTTDARAEVEK